MPKIDIQNLGLSIISNPGLSLLNNFLINKSPIHTVCGGRAQCGCCRIKILEGEKGISKVNNREIKKLGDELIRQGWRLSCQTHCLRDITVYMPVDEDLDDFCSEK
ncbi:MAG: 2Fe-2S iron-sulfur cluster binding domain-containing protein [Desulfobulbaceae bacterium]|nr:2Fe-2S iron-sulfur cluster binding domain-containing protein [Desulfobulbaceae bacterium]